MTRPHKLRYDRNMNMLNNSVVICEPTPRKAQKRVPLGSKKQAKTVKKTYYESPLKHIQQGNKRWELLRAHTRMTRSMKQRAKKANTLFCPETDFSVNDSIIVLSDNECEASDQSNKSSCRSSKKGKKSSLSTDSDKSNPITMEPLRALTITEKKKSQKSPKSSNAQKNKGNVRQNKKRKKAPLPDSEENTSCLLLSDTEDSDVQVTTNNTNGENIAPLSKSGSLGSDDIVVVWSSTKSNQLNRKAKSPCETREEGDLREETGKRLFMIDCTPNKKNLNCLECAEPSKKKRKLNAEERERKKEKDRKCDLPFSKPGLQLPNSCEQDGRNAFQDSTTANKETVNPARCTSDTFNTVPSTLPDISQLDRRPGTLREIIIDGNNVAMAHTKGKVFSEYGLKLVIDYFKRRGHTVKAFVPQYRRSLGHQLLEQWYADGIVVFTPSRNIGGRRITPYDDRFILEYATVCGGIVVSMDQYRDLYMEKPEWRDTIENRLLVPTFVGDYIMFPEDPLGRNGPRLDAFLRF